jgi:ankyrin repeat protein
MTRQEKYNLFIKSSKFKSFKESFKSRGLNYNNNYLAFYYYARYGYIDMVKFLIKTKVKSSKHNSLALSLSVDNNQYDMVLFLLKDKKADPSSNNNYPLLRASTNGCNEIIEVLWNDKRIKKNKYIKDILKNDNIDLYEKLIKKDIKFKASNF